MTTAQIIERVNFLEDQLEAIKWILASMRRERRYKQSIVKATSGILGKNFPSGTAYENRIRKSWDKRFIYPNQ